MNAIIEYRAENGQCPWVVRLRDGVRDLWFAYRSEDEARRKLPVLKAGWEQATAA